MGRYFYPNNLSCMDNIVHTAPAGPGSDRVIYTKDCGTFYIKSQGGNTLDARIEGPFKTDINSQIMAIVKKRGVTVGSGFDLTTALVRYINNHVDFSCQDKGKECDQIMRMAVIATTLIRITNDGNIPLLNRIINDFAKTVTRKR